MTFDLEGIRVSIREMGRLTLRVVQSPACSHIAPHYGARNARSFCLIPTPPPLATVPCSLGESEGSHIPHMSPLRTGLVFANYLEYQSAFQKYLST